MKNLLILFLSIVSFFSWSQENGELVFYFNSTSDYLNNNLSDKGVVPIIISQGDRFLEVKKFLDLETGKRNRVGRYPWALYIEDEPYFNLRFKDKVAGFGQRPELFVSADIIGKFCAIILHKDKPEVFKNNGSNYGGGLQGLLINESNNWGKHWKDKDGFKVRILVVDTDNLEEGFKYAIWKILTKRNFNKILNLSLTKDEIKSMTLEYIEKIILDINRNN